MSLLVVILLVVIIGVVLWLINRFIPMDPTIARILNIAVAVILVIWLLKVAGVWGSLSSVKL